MNFLNLEYFLVAAEELNFTRASKRLFISQQSLSSHISKLEEDFQVQLFERSSPLRLTTEGKYLVARAKEICRMRDDTVREIRDIGNREVGDIIIGSPRSWGRLLLPYILPEYTRRYPLIQLHLEEGTRTEINAKLSDGTLDLGFGFLPDESSGIEAEVLCTERILLLVPYKVIHEIYRDASKTIISSLMQKPDVSVIRDCPFLLSDETSRTGTVARDIFRDLGITPHVVLESRNLETLLELCLRGMGCMFCPETFVAEAILGRNIASPTELGVYELPYPNCNRAIAISTPSSKYKSKAVRDFIRLAKECVNDGPFNMGKLI